MLKKEKKNRLSAILAMALLLCLAVQPVWAADQTEYPIRIDSSFVWSYDDPLGYGRAVDGSVFVPLRVLFEKMSATVDWQESTRSITIKRCDGAVLQMDIGQSDAQITRLGQTTELTMPAPRLIDGVTYIPLRFVAENLLCDVIWDNTDKTVTLRKNFVNTAIDGKSYTLDFATGEVTELAAGGVMRSLGQVPELADTYKAKRGWVYDWTIGDVNELADGRVIVDISGGPMDPPVSHEMRLLLTDKVQNNRYIWGAGAPGQIILPDYYIDGADFWWPEGDAVYKLDADGAVLTEYKYADMLVNAKVNDSDCIFCFTDGEYMLLNSSSPARNGGSAMILVNIRTKEAVDLVDELLSKEEQKQRGFLYSTVEDGGFLRFEKAEDGVLYLTCHYFAADEPLLLTYKYK